MSANREQDAIQHGAAMKHGYIAITVQGHREYVAGPFASHDEAYEATRFNTGTVSICPITYRRDL